MKKKFVNLNTLEKESSSQITRMNTEKAHIKISDFTILDTPDLIALNKPSGLLSIPDREGKDISLKKLLIEKYDNIFTVHRLDKDTSGLIVFAKNETTHKLLSQQFEERQTEKIYLGLVLGSLAEKKGSMRFKNSKSIFCSKLHGLPIGKKNFSFCHARSEMCDSYDRQFRKMTIVS